MKVCMTKVEYKVAMEYCHLRCEPQDDKCKECQYMKVFKKIYEEE